jgi:D-tyrosyl-tRNA(Tyr) deacylase
LIQRVKRAWVFCSSGKREEIGRGILVYVGFEADDNEGFLEKCAVKISNLRIFEDERGKMNLSVLDVGGEILLVPNFTLAGDARKGNRPSFDNALRVDLASILFDKFAEILSRTVPTKTGVFRDSMLVFSENDGPVNILLKLP